MGGHGGRLSSRSQTLHLCTLTERHVNTMLQPSVCPFNRTLVHVGCATRGCSVKVRSQSESTPPEMTVHCHHGILRPGILVTCHIWHLWCTRVFTGGLPATIASLICRYWSMQGRGNPGACTLAQTPPVRAEPGSTKFRWAGYTTGRIR